MKFLLIKIDLSEITHQQAQDLFSEGYVCVPIVTKSESLTVAQNLTSERSVRQTEENLTFCTPPPGNKYKTNNVIRMSAANKNTIVQSSGENKSYFHQTAIHVKRHYSQSCQDQFENPYTKNKKLQ